MMARTTQISKKVPLQEPTPECFKPLIERGIARDVWEERGYVPYFGRHHPRWNPALVLRELMRYQMTPEQRRAYVRWTDDARDKAHDSWQEHQRTSTSKRHGTRTTHWMNLKPDGGHGYGLIMHKYAFPSEPEVLPQLRPNDKVHMGVSGHVHSKMDELKLDEHLEKEKRLRRRYGDGPVADVDAWHWHHDVVKYLLPPNPRVKYFHDHATDRRFTGAFGRGWLELHMRNEHEDAFEHGTPVVGEHAHWRDDKTGNIANRYDIHPWALERIGTAEIVFLGIEGTPKADAILTWILAHDMPASVFNVPSVTLWKVPEMERVAKRYLLENEDGRTPLVVIVPDADWHGKVDVARAAFRHREALRALGVNACVAAPPLVKTARGYSVEHKGVDDFIAAGGDLPDLVVVDREAPESPVKQLALHADTKTGKITGSISGLATLLQTRKDARHVFDRLASLVEQGYLTVNRDLGLEQNELGQHSWVLDVDPNWLEIQSSWQRFFKQRGIAFEAVSPSWGDGRDRLPVFTIREDLRASERLVPLSEYTGLGGMTREDRVLRRVTELWVAAGTITPLWTLEQLDEALEYIAAADRVEVSTLGRIEGKRLRELRRELRARMLREDPRPATDQSLQAEYGVSESTIGRARAGEA